MVKLSKEYRTRSGERVILTRICEQMKSYPVEGYILKDNEKIPEIWALDGKHTAHKSSDLDLVECQ